jgi:hypothetical protein
MTFGDDPFGHNKGLRGIKPLEFIIGFLLIWYLISHLI